MTDIPETDPMLERYERISEIRKRAIDMLALSDETLSLTLADKEASKLLVKLLDGEDKQTIARQKNTTDEKLVDAVGTSLNDAADMVIRAMGGQIGMRGEPDSSSAPKESIPIQVEVNEGELDMGIDPELNYDSLSK